MFQLVLTRDAHDSLEGLKDSPEKQRNVHRALARLERDPRHPGLHSHPFHTFSGPGRETIWESCVEIQRSAAWRIWWFYGPEEGQITIVAIGPDTQEYPNLSVESSSCTSRAARRPDPTLAGMPTPS